MTYRKYFKEDKLKDNDHRNGYFTQFDLDKVKTFLDIIEPVAYSKNVTLSQLVLRWTTLQPGITVVLAGSRNAEQAIQNAAAMDIDLNNDELNFIKQELLKAI
nr:aldo/keto reductase [Pedobacter sp. HMWF019]